MMDSEEWRTEGFGTVVYTWPCVHPDLCHLTKPDVMKTKWAATLQGEEILESNESLEFFSGVKAHQKDSATIEKFEKVQSATLCNFGLSDDQTPLGLASCRNVVHLDLSSNNLTTIPDVTFSLLKLKIVNFSSNRIQHIPSNIKLLTHLEKVNLSFNNISELSPVTACTNLQMLWIAGNRLSDIPTDMRNLNELKELHLSRNVITNITPVVECAKLQILNVRYNQLEAVPRGLVKLGELKELDLSYNKITDISPVVECVKLRLLEVCFNQLKALPAGLVKLGELKELDLSGNRITDCTLVVECAKLQKLNLEHNHLVALPAELVKLGELKTLDLSYNNYFTLSISTEISHPPGLIMTSVRMRLSSFREISDMRITPVVECVKLQILKVCGNNIVALPAGLAKLGELKVLDLSKNKITDITPVVACAKLQILKVTRNQLKALPAGLVKLGELKELDLSENNITDITPVVECARLQILKVTNNQLVGLPAGLVKLSELKELDLFYNQITDITPVVACARLQILKVTRNQLKALPAGLVKLGELKELDLSENKITDIISVVGCTKLQHLGMSNNKLVTIPTDIKKLRQLQSVDLSFNEVEDLNGLCECTNLVKLRCSYNKLSRLPEGITQLSKLKFLDIQHNEINQLPLYFDRCDSLKFIEYIGNKLTRPPLEVCYGGPKQIFQYFKDLRATECTLRKQQVVLLGETSAGKTSLALTLMNGRSSLTDHSDRTQVLQKYTWIVKDALKLLITDFGGHEVYELAHSVFLCSEVIALLAVDLHQYTSDKYHDLVGRWVNTMLFTSPKSTVMVVCTHSDCCTKEFIETSYQDILDQLRNQQTRLAEYVKSQLRDIEVKLQSAIGDELQSYSRILEETRAAKRKELEDLQQGFVQREHVFVVSSGDTMSGISELRHALITCCERKAVTLPESWLLIEDRMNEKDVKDKLYLWKAEFSSIVNRKLSSSGFQADQPHKTAEAILSYQRRCGGFLWFKDDNNLKQYIFHKPEMIVDFLKSIFHHDMDTLLDYSNPVFGARFSKIVFEKEKENLLQHGKISSKLLRCLVERFVPDEGMLRTMINLLVKFFLCFTVSENDDGRCLMFPWFLRNDEPPALKVEKWLPPSPDEYLYEVKFIFPVQCPTGFFERAVVILHQQFAQFEESAQDVIVWKNGVYLHKDDDKAMLTRKQEEGQIFVTLSVRGNEVTTAWPHFERAYYDVVNLLKQWPGASCNMLYMCSHCLISGQKEPTCFTANKLLESRRNLGKYLPCKNSKDKRVPVDVVIPTGVIDALSESPPPKRRRVVVDTVDRVHSEKIGATRPLRDSEILCQRSKDTVFEHLHESLTQAFRSVAKVTWSNGFTGSGFRVGTHYLMTNYHVVREGAALDEEKEEERQSTRLCLFHYSRPYQRHDELHMKSFYFAPDPVKIYDEDLDYAVLELLIEEGKELPEALNKFTKLDRHKKITIAGHPEGEAKRVDATCPIVHDPSAGPNIALYQASEKMAFGSSGSPGFVSDAQCNARVAVVHSGRYNDLVPPGPQTYAADFINVV